MMAAQDLSVPGSPILELTRLDGEWPILLVGGVTIKCRVGIPIKELLEEEFGLDEETVERGIETLFLNGKPVDDLAATIMPDGGRLALAAGLPGIAGLAMKRGSAVRGLRPGLTITEKQTATPAEGQITMALFSLLLPALSGHFLKRGVWIKVEQALDKLKKSLEHEQHFLWNGRATPSVQVQDELAALPANQLVRLKMSSS